MSNRVERSEYLEDFYLSYSDSHITVDGSAYDKKTVRALITWLQNAIDEMGENDESDESHSKGERCSEASSG